MSTIQSLCVPLWAVVVSVQDAVSASIEHLLVQLACQSGGEKLLRRIVQCAEPFIFASLCNWCGCSTGYKLFSQKAFRRCVAPGLQCRDQYLKV